MADSTSQYELIDFGDGRKLERFGDVVLDRPSPAAEHTPKSKSATWRRVHARFEGSRMSDGVWLPEPTKWTPADWLYEHRGNSSFRLQLEALPSGQVGFFPEQRENWSWIAERVANGLATLGRPPKILNLFAYTGGSTLAAASAGAEVVHIDAAQNIVDRARANAGLSGLADRPIRWIAEEATRFCQREVKRGKQYDAIILDPPTYGHGPKGELWKIGEHLLPLLELCGQLTKETRAFMLLTCHSPGIGPAELAAYLSEGIFGHCGQPPKSGELYLETANGRRLPSGTYARWPKEGI
jgi:23S rRNA (cytosine1962-C5)-methyltransferase